MRTEHENEVFTMGFFDKVRLAGQGAAAQTKLFAETAKLNGHISDEEKQINNIFNQIGRSYYEANKNNPDAEYRSLMVSISDAQVRIENYHEQIRKLKCLKSCPNCGAEVASSALYCNVCGAKLPTDNEEKENTADAPAAKCPQCGADVEPGSKFCGSCGYSMPEEQPEASTVPAPVEPMPSASAAMPMTSVTDSSFAADDSGEAAQVPEATAVAEKHEDSEAAE